MDEIQRLIIQAEGTDKIRELSKELDKQNALFQKSIELHKQGVLTDDQYASAMRGRARQIKAVNDQIDEVTRGLSNAVGGMGSSGRTQQGVLNLGYAVQDFISTSGGLAQKLNSVTNNLQSFATSLGVGGSMFIGVTAVLSALQLFTNNWEKIGDAVTGFDREKFDAAAKKAADLKSQFEQLAATPTKAAGKTSSAWKDAITEADASKMQKDIAESLFRSPFGAKETPEDRAAMEEAGKKQTSWGVNSFGVPTQTTETDEQVKARVALLGKQIQDRIAKENADAAAAMLAQASGTGPGAEQARRNIMRLQRENPGTPTLGKFDPWMAEWEEGVSKQSKDFDQWDAEDQREAMNQTNAAFGDRARRMGEAAQKRQDALGQQIRQNVSRDRQQRRRANGPLQDQSVSIGEEFNARSLDEGVQWSPDQVRQAAGFIQQQMGQGVDSTTAMQQAFMGLLQQAQAQRQQQMMQMNSFAGMGAMGGAAVETPMYYPGQFPGG